MKYTSILMLLIVLFSLLSVNETKSSINNSSNKDYENNAKIGDYVEYKLPVTFSQAIDNYGRPGKSILFNSTNNGFLRWTVTGIAGKNITLNIEISVPTVYSVVKEVTIFNGTMYNPSNHNAIGYNPFWISLNASQEKNVTLAGTSNNPLLGENVNSNSHLEYLGGYRDVFEFDNTNQYVQPGVYGSDIGWYQLFYSKYNGIMVELGNTLSTFFWITLQFSYEFTTYFTVSKSNIDFGSINYGYTILSYIAPLWLPIFIISGIVIIYLVIKVKKWKNNRY